MPPTKSAGLEGAGSLYTLGGTWVEGAVPPLQPATSHPTRTRHCWARPLPAMSLVEYLPSLHFQGSTQGVVLAIFNDGRAFFYPLSEEVTQAFPCPPPPPPRRVTGIAHDPTRPRTARTRTQCC